MYYANVGIENPERAHIPNYGTVEILYHIAHPSLLPSQISVPSPPTMPRAIQPGGGSGKMRVRYTACRKRGLVAASRHMQAEGMLLRAVTSELRVSTANLSKWASQGVGKIDHLDKILRSKKKAALPGPVSQLKAIKGALLCYIFEYREQGVSVNTFNLTLRASFILPEFREKSFTARCSAVKRFMTDHSFSY